jgi:pyruvate/2-oxoglutarate dehydrogenase complex dihydrolipoamide acyltransferase (E2) component
MSKLVFPVLMRASEHAPTPYETQVLEDLAMGVVPAGHALVSIHHNLIIFGHAGVYAVKEDTDPAQACEDVLSLWRRITERTDLPETAAVAAAATADDATAASAATAAANAAAAAAAPPTIRSWQDLRRKNRKDVLLYRYASLLGVPSQHREYFVQQIRTLLVLKLIDAKNIVMSDIGDIADITGIRVDPATGHVAQCADDGSATAGELAAAAAAKSNKPPAPASAPAACVSVYDAWSKYIKTLADLKPGHTLWATRKLT